MVWMMVDHLPTIRLGIDWSMVMLIWLVQLVIYPAFRVVDRDRFKQWHHNYMRTISYIVVPLMFAQLICIAMSMIAGGSAGNTVALLAVLIAWLVTFTQSVPCHRKLQELGNDENWVARVIHTNWMRTAAWTVAAVAETLS